MKITRIFIDCEFTSPDLDANIISIGLVSEDGAKSFYQELGDTWTTEECSLMVHGKSRRCVVHLEDLHFRVRAPCRAHNKKARRKPGPSCLFSGCPLLDCFSSYCRKSCSRCSIYRQLAGRNCGCTSTLITPAVVQAQVTPVTAPVPVKVNRPSPVDPSTMSPS